MADNQIKYKHIPQRMCVICRRRYAKTDLERYVLSEDGNLMVDKKKIMPGRGWHLCAEAACRANFSKFRPKKRASGGKGSKRSQGEV